MNMNILEEDCLEEIQSMNISMANNILESNHTLPVSILCTLFIDHA
jgi:hypothetical protein